MLNNVRYWQKAYFGAMGGNPWESSKPKSTKKKATGKKKTVAKKTGKRKTKRATTGDLFGLF